MLSKLKQSLPLGSKKEIMPASHVTDELIRHVKQGNRQFHLDLGTASLDALLEDALERDPRLLYLLMNLNIQSKGAYHDVKVSYRPNLETALKDVVVLRPGDPVDSLRDALEQMPKNLGLVANDKVLVEGYLSSLLQSSDLPHFIGYEGPVSFSCRTRATGMCG